jgi:hypothetical protein
MHLRISFVRLSADNIVEPIRDHPTGIINKLLRDPILKLYLKETLVIEKVSHVKRQFLKWAIKELDLTSIELSHIRSNRPAEQENRFFSIISSAKRNLFSRIFIIQSETI